MSIYHPPIFHWYLSIGIGIGDIEYIDKYRQLRVVFGYFEQQDVDYEFLLDEVFFFIKLDDPMLDEDGLGPEVPIKDPFINVYKDSKVLSFVKEQLMFNDRYDETDNFLHYQLAAQNMILYIISRSEPVINRIEEECFVFNFFIYYF